MRPGVGVCGPRCWAWGQRGLYMDTPEGPGRSDSIWGLGGYFQGRELCCFIPQTPKTCRSAGEGNRGRRASQEPSSCFRELSAEGRESRWVVLGRSGQQLVPEPYSLARRQRDAQSSLLNTAPISEPGCPSVGGSPDSAPSGRLTLRLSGLQ